MSIGRRVKHSRRIIISGVQLAILSAVIAFIAWFFGVIWLAETACIVAILVALFTLLEYVLLIIKIKKYKRLN